MINLEVCANSIESAINAEKGGAIRVELCENLNEGGTTPSFGQIQKTIQLIDIQINILIRPRAGDFLYSNLEFEIMKEDIHQCGQLGCNGVVFGILNKDGSIDKNRNQELVDIANNYSMKTTFHRAFDRTPDIHNSLEEVIDLGFDHILTSGGKKSALEGKKTLRKLIVQANSRIIIMPGGGITTENIQELVKETDLKEFHGSFQSPYQSEMEYKSEYFDNENTGYHTFKTDAKKVKQAILNANNI